MLSGDTRLAGVIGYPVSHSLSPRMHGAAFEALGLDWAYVPLAVEPERLGTAVAGLVALGFAGANVTTPHKTAVLAYCDEVDDVARRAGSVNTLVLRDGRVIGSSTDGQAVAGAVDADGVRVVVLGAGGAAQAVAAALVEAGAARLTVAARRQPAAAAVVEHLRTTYPHRYIDVSPIWPPETMGSGLVVQATPLRDDVLVEPRPGQQIVDLAYRPDGSPTALVAAAREADCDPVVDGLEVLVRQGAASFERFTGRPAPVRAMRAALRAGR